jgi:hypothetical protein
MMGTWIGLHDHLGTWNSGFACTVWNEVAKNASLRP